MENDILQFYDLKPTSSRGVENKLIESLKLLKIKNNKSSMLKGLDNSSLDEEIEMKRSSSNLNLSTINMKKNRDMILFHQLSTLDMEGIEMNQELSKQDSKKTKSFSANNSFIADSEEFLEDANSCTQIAKREFQNDAFREYMEDFTCIEDKYRGDINEGLFCIFDGHGGSNVAKNLKLLFSSLLNEILKISDSVEKALKIAFLSIDSHLQKTLSTIDKEGSTATVVYITREKNKKVAFCANVGDSPCFAVYKDRVEKINTDHKCLVPEELCRLKSSGCLIVKKRIFGTLIISRAIGDIEFRKYGVICIPSISKIEITDDLLYIILGSDGVLEMLSLEQIHKLSIEKESAQDLVSALFEAAQEKKSRDNMSCIALKFNYYS